MQKEAGDFDLARNIKAIEWLKTEIVVNAAMVCRALQSTKDQLVQEALADTMLCCYLLARKLGVSYSRLENAVQERARKAFLDDPASRQWSRDLSDLAEHLQVRRKT